jgi:hypothetical protein
LTFRDIAGNPADEMSQLGLILLGSLLIAIGLTWLIGPVRLLAGIVAVPIAWAIISVVAIVVWLSRIYGAAP